VEISEFNFCGHHIKLDTENGNDQVAHGLREGTYEAPLPMVMIATICRLDGAFIDVGANTGLYSVIAAKVASGRPIIAFEPLPSALRIFKRNIKNNFLEGKIEIFETALSNHCGEATLYIPDPSHGLVETSASLEEDFKPRTSETQSVVVKTTKFDSLSIPGPIGVIKADIEGHEHAFLEGAMAAIHRERPIIFLEILYSAQRNYISMLIRDLGYISFRLRPDLAIHDNGEINYDPQAWNHAFVPAERLHRFQEACNSCGVTLVRRFKSS
jgi:FkbM family methyltransferase